jgi:hypothetical protein
MWYGKSPFQIYNDVDRAFYESIRIGTREYAALHEEYIQKKEEVLSPRPDKKLTVGLPSMSGNIISVAAFGDSAISPG